MITVINVTINVLLALPHRQTVVLVMMVLDQVLHLVAVLQNIMMMDIQVHVKLATILVKPVLHLLHVQHVMVLNIEAIHLLQHYVHVKIDIMIIIQVLNYVLHVMQLV